MHTFLSLELRQKLTVFLIVLATFVLWVIDAIDDLSHGSSWKHLALEAIVLIMAAFWIVSVAVRYFASRTENIRIKTDLAQVRKDLENYQKETQHLIKGLSLKISEQLDKWNMTNAEKDVALLLLKGFSNKEIADIRATSEKTVTQQISSIYMKSNLKSRSEFAAFFLEELLLPPN